MKYVEEEIVLDKSGSDNVAASKMLDSSSKSQCTSTRVLRSMNRNSVSPNSKSELNTVHVDNIPVCTDSEYDDSISIVNNETLTSEAAISRLLRKRTLPEDVVINPMGRPKSTRSQRRVTAFDHLASTPSIESDGEFVADYLYLVGSTHRDDDDMLLYKTTRVYIHKGTNEIVGDRALVLKDGSTFHKDESDPIRIKDIAILTKRYKNERDQLSRINYAHLVTGETRGFEFGPESLFCGMVTDPTSSEMSEQDHFQL